MNKTRVIALLLALCLIIGCLPAYAAGEKIIPSTSKLSGYNKFNPAENTFCIDGKPDKKYIILDSDSDGFLILANEICDVQPFDADNAQKFEVTKENNIAYYLNNTLINDENLMPSEFVPYIDSDRVWSVEGGADSGVCSAAYSAVCGVSLLSYTEFMKYYKKFGLQDDAARVNWWLRSPHGSDPKMAIICGGTYADEGKVKGSNASLAMGVRPLFWVERSFFADVKISIAESGANVKKILCSKLTADYMKDGKAGYNDYELKRLGFNMSGVPSETAKFFFPNEPMYVQNQSDAYFTAEVSHSGSVAAEYAIEYSSDGLFDDTVSVDYTVKPGMGISQKIDLSGLKKGKYNDFTVRVVNEYGVLAQMSVPLTIMEYVDLEPLSEYSRVGINWHIDYNTSHFTQRGAVVEGEAHENYNKLLSFMGITKTRSIHRWAWAEVEKGVRNNGKHNYEHSLMRKYDQVFDPYILGHGNALYFPEDPRTYKNVMDEVEWCVDIMDYLDKQGIKRDSLELWNEPNITSFWKTTRRITYYQLANRLGFEMNNRYPDIPLYGCTLAMGSDAYDFAYDFFARGGLMYVGGLSSHPYSHPTSPDTESVARNHTARTNDMLDARDRIGGWVDLIQSEIGYPTASTAASVDRKTQAEYLTKHYIYNDDFDMSLTNIYTFEDTGWNYNDNEHNWGVVDLNLVPKEAVITIAQLNKYCANAEYLGRFAIDESSYVYVYNKLGKLFAVMWAKSDDGTATFEYTLKPCESAEDMYGNPIEGDTIPVGADMVYLNGISDDYAAKAVSEKTYEAFDRLLTVAEGNFDTAYLNKLRGSITAENCTSAAGVKTHIDKIYAYGDRLIEEYKANPDAVALDRLTALLSDLYYISLRLVNTYTYFGGTAEKSDANIEKTEAKIAEIKGDEPQSSLLYTDAVMRFAKQHNIKANEIREKYKSRTAGVAAAIAASDLLANKLLVWVNMLSGIETPDVSRAIFTYLKETDVSAYKEQSYEYKMEVENLSAHDINGTVVMRDESGNILGDEMPCTVAKDGYANVTFCGTVPSSESFGSHVYTIDIMQDGKLMKRSYMNVEIKEKLNASLSDAEDTVENLEDIGVEINSTFNAKVSGTVKLTAPDGWQMESTEQKFEIAPGESERISFKIASAEKKPFNEYEFTYTVLDDNGELLAGGTKLLDFTIATRAGGEINVKNFDGDISDWANAYPIHINPPDDLTSLDAWKNANIAVKSYMKWDENYYYVLTDVYDDLHYQGYTGNQMWQGDSLQIAFDTLNNDTTAYANDDYEFGIGQTALGTEVEAYAAGDPNTAGSRSAEWAKIIRDNDNKITRYLVRLPKDEIYPLDLKQGTTFGYNICVNDADVLNRDKAIEFTAGVNGAKRPNLFKTFTLVGTSDSAQLTPDGNYSSVVKMNDTGFGS